MKVLIIKLSSLGDLVHTIPAITDAAGAVPNIEFHWATEPDFSEIPKYVPHVTKVIEVPLRAWKARFMQVLLTGEFTRFLKELRKEKYDLVIDAQGLLKSAMVGAFVKKDILVGFDKKSSREALASVFYGRKIFVDKNQHAIFRLRKLFADTLNYNINPTENNIQYDIELPGDIDLNDYSSDSYCMFLHGTTWSSKHWPDEYWDSLAKKLDSYGVQIFVNWYTKEQHQRVLKLESANQNILNIGKLSLSQAISYIKNAQFVVSVDTGFSHLAAMLNKTNIALYGATDIDKVGVLGTKQMALQANYKCSPCYLKKCKYNTDLPPCYTTLNPEIVLEQIKKAVNLDSLCKLEA